ncbi:hypothetical protein NIES3585_14870 [Nodularia sp. NIES-3585]|nr:hypothetical protein NIES3585_14870 [Nodularia sp. NIES-3585]
MEKVFAKKPGFLPDKETEFLILDKVELRVFQLKNDPKV